MHRGIMLGGIYLKVSACDGMSAILLSILARNDALGIFWALWWKSVQEYCSGRCWRKRQENFSLFEKERTEVGKGGPES